MFGHLYLYEIVLLFLGIILFLILSTAMVLHIIRKEPFGKLFYFFFIPILMIGYTSIREFQVGELHISMDRQIQEVMDNPNDPEAIKELEASVNELRGRAGSPEEKLRLSKAYLLLNKPEDAIKLANEIEEEGTKVENHSIQIEEIKKLAEIQKEISKPEKDTVKIKLQLENADIRNPEMESYFKDRYISH